MLPGRRPSFSAGLACASLGVHSSPSLALKSRPDSRINGAIIMNRPYRFRAISTAALVSSFLLFTTAKQTTQARIPTPPPTSCSTTTIDMKRSEEHTSELQSRLHLVCRLLLEKKKQIVRVIHTSHTDN